MEQKEKVKDFLGKLYVPKERATALRQLRYYLGLVNLRALEGGDKDGKGRPILIIETSGKGERETFMGYHVMTCIVDSIGSTYATAILTDRDNGEVTARRLNVKSAKNSIIV